MINRKGAGALGGGATLDSEPPKRKRDAIPDWSQTCPQTLAKLTERHLLHLNETPTVRRRSDLVHHPCAAEAAGGHELAMISSLPNHSIVFSSLVANHPGTLNVLANPARLIPTHHVVSGEMMRLLRQAKHSSGNF